MELVLLQGEAVTGGLDKGAVGRSVFGWAPVVDGFGKVKAIVQVEASMDAALAATFRSFALLGAFLFFGLGGSIALGAMRLRRSCRALSELGTIAQSGVLEDPYLADDISTELIELTQALEVRRGIEESMRAEQLMELARDRKQALLAVRESHGQERLRLALSKDFPASIRRLAAAVGRVDAQDMQPEDRQSLRESVLKSCDLARVLDQHRELAELRAGRIPLRKQKVCLSTMVEEAVAGTRKRARAADVDLRVVVGGKIPAAVQADAELLRRCLTNLAENAVQAVARAGGGSVSLRVKMLEGTDSADIRFELCDSAPGMTPTEIETLFEPFPSTSGEHKRRSGELDASMALTQELLRLHGAEISLETVPGAGTRIFFTIAFHNKAQAVPASMPLVGAQEELPQGTIEFELGRR